MINTNKPSDLLAWWPKGILGPRRVLYAMVPPGEVTMDIWLDCLANRVQQMLDRKKWFKRKLANKICKLMKRPPCEDLDDFGKHIIEYNSYFKNSIAHSIIEGKPFPSMVSEHSKEAYEDIQICQLETWAGLAKLIMSGIMLNGYHQHKEYGLNKHYFDSKEKIDLFK